MWLESLLFHTLPSPVGNFLHKYSMPALGTLCHLHLVIPLPVSIIRGDPLTCWHFTSVACLSIYLFLWSAGRLVASLGNAFYESEQRHIPKVRALALFT